MLSDAAQHILDDFARITGLALDVGESGFNASSKISVRDAESDFVLLARLGQIDLQQRCQVFRSYALGYIIRVLKRLRRASETGQQANVVEYANFPTETAQS